MSQGRQRGVALRCGSEEEAATRLLGLQGLAVQAVVLDTFGVRHVHLVTEEEAAAACPQCGVVSTSVKERPTTRPRDIPYGPVPLRLWWHKIRWRCQEARCSRATFTECLEAVPARARLTTRLRTECAIGIAERLGCVAGAAGYYGIDWRIAHQAYAAHADPVPGRPLPPVRVLGIDEIRRGRPQWAQDPVTGRWQVIADRWSTGLVDAAGTGGLLGHVDGRTAAALTDWLQAHPQWWREGISHVTIDLPASYAKAVTQALPHAVLVADRFHLVALANQTLTEVRQRLTRDVRGRRGRKVDPEWANRRRLLTGRQRLSPRAFTRMWNQLIDSGDPGTQLLLAYAVKESLRDLLALAGTNPDRATIREHLWTFYDLAAASRAPEVHRLAATIETWWPAVLAAITTGYSNARSEGYNRLAKHQGRNAFGFRNTTHQSRRIRWACTRQHRRATATAPRLPGQV